MQHRKLEAKLDRCGQRVKLTPFYMNQSSLERFAFSRNDIGTLSSTGQIGSEAVPSNVLHSVDTHHLRGATASLLPVPADLTTSLLPTIAQTAAELAANIRNQETCDLKLLKTVTNLLSNWHCQHDQLEEQLFADIACDLNFIATQHPSLPDSDLYGLLSALNVVEAAPPEPRLQAIYIDSAFHGGIHFIPDVS